MDFLGKMAKDSFSGNANSSSNNDSTNNDTNQSTNTGNSWSDVGRAAKSAYETQSGDNGGGAGDKKPIDYAQVGGVAKKAAAAYNAGGGKLDAQTVGKEFASGFMGKGQQQQQGSPVCFWF
jgi:hypothetical protein